MTRNRRTGIARTLVASIGSAALSLIATTPATAQQQWPAKPIRLVVGFSPGGAADVVARTVGESLSRVLGQPVIVENRAGAGSSIAADYVAHAAPDGYTILLGSPAAISVNPALNAKLNYRRPT